MDDRRAEEWPPFSRIFVVCEKKLTETEMRPHFEEFGTIENFHVPRDSNTGESKGIAYVKYSKTSSAAAAIENLNLKRIGNTSKPIKVFVASNKSEDSRNVDVNKYTRLFVVLPKNESEAELVEHFKKFGNVVKTYFLKNNSNLAFINYANFFQAATAFEECDRKYKAVFARPKDELKRNRDSLESGSYSHSVRKDYFSDEMSNHKIGFSNPQTHGFRKVNVTVCPQVPNQYIYKLFDVVAHIEGFEYSVDHCNGVAKALITYSDPAHASRAVEKLNNFEFPSGELVQVVPKTAIAQVTSSLSHVVNELKSVLEFPEHSSDLTQLAEVMAKASAMLKNAAASELEYVSFCNVKLPTIKPFATADTSVAKRCFIVCKPSPPPLEALKDVFCRFGNLIDITIIPTKNYGYVKYATCESADEAIKTLHAASVCGVHLKVMEAEEKPGGEENDRKKMRMDNTE